MLRLFSSRIATLLIISAVIAIPVRLKLIDQTISIAYASDGTETTTTQDNASPQNEASTIVSGSAAGALTHKIFIPGVLTPPPQPIYWGAIVDGQAPSNVNMQPGGLFDTFEKRIGKKMAIIHWGQPWKMNNTYQPFYAPWFDNVRNHGSIPMLDWGSFLLTGGPNQPEFTLNAIYSGKHDAYIQQWAQAAKAWGYPFFLRFDWEMNGNWGFPWSEQLNGNQPGDFIKAWRHVHDIFSRTGAHNVTWVWCPNVSGTTTIPMSSVYPGSAYVDWACMDGYNKYPVWLGFNSIFTGSGINWLGNSYMELQTVAAGKPMMIGEFASLEAGDGGAKKAAWIADALLTQLPTHFPAVKAIVWFNWDVGSPPATFPVESTNSSLDAFAAAIDKNYFATNSFRDLNTSPIPVPR